MRNILTLGALALGLIAPLGPEAKAAPLPGEKPVRYEYAELRWIRTYMPAPALPGRKAPLAAEPVISVRWATGEEEIETNGWEDLANRLKAPAPKKESSSIVHKLRVLNALSAAGWELVDSPGPEPRDEYIWSFRRRAP
jgi:hypothetical protein